MAPVALGESDRARAQRISAAANASKGGKSFHLHVFHV
jgi:hypothetical protein